MTWLRRYRIRSYIRSSIWVVPSMWGMSAILFHRAAWEFDLQTRWNLLGYSQEGARGVVGTLNSSMFTFMVFLLTMLLIAVQIASAQLTPRVVSGFFRDRVVRNSLGGFLFSYMFSLAVQGRISDPPPQLTVLLTILLSVASLGVFLYLVDYTGKLLTPSRIYLRVAAQGADVIGDVYPARFKETAGALAEDGLFRGAEPTRTIGTPGIAGYLLAFDGAGLAESARRADCVIRIAPQVGDFLASGDPLFHVYQGGESVKERDLLERVAIGPARTMEQDPELAFRLIVDIAIKALSPAINDPTTAVLGIDQIHRLLHMLGTRDLGDGRVRDAAGRVRLTFPTPDWEDFVLLGVSEIRQYGAGSVQVVRRLRAMLDHLIEVLPPARLPLLREQRELLDKAVKRGFGDAEDRAVAGGSDFKGIGGSRGQGEVPRGALTTRE